jgi:type IX secretion system substrate protein
MSPLYLESSERSMEDVHSFHNFAKTCLLTVLFMAAFSIARSQNLVANPGAELTPAGTGWTIASSGANTCAAGSAASTYSNWTMTPDGSANYPSAHGGTKTFYAGCNTIVPAGPFELNQTIDVSASASQIDGGFVSFTFSGYIQTPIAAQADAGRFIVDYLNSGGTVLGTSYTSSYQSGTGGSGSSWVPYTNTRLAASGTRKVRIRLQTTIATGPAINAYFDDISLTELVALPIVLVSFTGKQNNNNIDLNWSVNDALDFSGFEIEKSSDASTFVPAGTVDYVKGKSDYYYSEKNTPGFASIFYRLKMTDITGLFSYSPTLVFNNDLSQHFAIFPNPASNNILVTGLHNDGALFIRNTNGNTVLQFHISASRVLLDISMLQKGIYFVSYANSSYLVTHKLIVQ